MAEAQKLHVVILNKFLFWIVVLMEDPTMAHYKISSREMLCSIEEVNSQEFGTTVMTNFSFWAELFL